MINKSEIQIGQIVYLEPIKSFNKTNVQQCHITKIGRKYITVKLHNNDIQFQLEDGRQKNTGYGADWKLYFSEQEIKDTHEGTELYSAIRKAFDWANVNRYTLEQLRNIADTLNVR